MGAVQKISISLSTEMLADAQARVDQGDYTSISEVVRDALRRFDPPHISRAEAIARLRALWEEGLASGEGQEFVGEDQFIAAVKNVHSERKK
jgi:antitoxin ParD1/3/4